MIWLLTILMIVIFGIEVVLSGSPQIQTNVLFKMGATYPPAILNGAWWRLISAGFLHGSIIHILGNLVMFVALGQMIEKMIGSFSVLLLFINSIFAGNLLSLWLDTPNTLNVGASGGIFGFLGAFIIFGILARQPEVWREQTKGMVVLVGLSIVLSIMTPGISVWGHVGGVIGGLLLTAGVMWRPSLKASFKVTVWVNGLSWILTLLVYGGILMLVLKRFGG